MTTDNQENLIRAINAGDHTAARALLAHTDPNFAMPDAIHDPSLVTRHPYGSRGMVEIRDGNFETLAYRVEHKTPLTLAISKNDLEMVRLLLDNKADLNMQDLRGFYPITLAVDSTLGDEIVQLLLDKGANPNVRTLYGNSTPLISRSSMGDAFNTVSALLSNGADPHAIDGQGRTALDRHNERGGWSEMRGTDYLRLAFMTVAHPPVIKELVTEQINHLRTGRLLRHAMNKSPRIA